MYDVEKRSAVLESFARLDTYIYSPITKWRHWGNKLPVPPTTVQVRMPPAVNS